MAYLAHVLHNPVAHPGERTVLGMPVTLQDVGCDMLIVAGITDHITPWQGCYATTQMLGGRSEFLLSSSGHIQSIINPPGNTKAKFYRNRQQHLPSDPAAWLAAARAEPGSWWPYWRGWGRHNPPGPTTPPRRRWGARPPP